jgi:C1A family cysteine protease
MRGYSYSIEENWISRLSSEEKAHFFMRRGPVDESVRRALAMRLPVEPDLPAHFDLRNVGGRSYLHPITETQSDPECGDCYAFATMAAAEGCFNRYIDASGPYAHNFSEAHLAWKLAPYYEGFGYCNGATASFDQLRAMVEYGAAEEFDCPYTGGAPVDCDVLFDDLIQFDDYYVLNGDTDQIKTAIYRHGPVYATVHAGVGFKMYTRGIYDDDERQCTLRRYEDAYHAVAIVGWDDGDFNDQGHWIVRNSWRTGGESGPLWGEDGYMRLAYGAAMSSCEVGVLVKGFSQPEPESNDGGCFFGQLIDALGGD